MNARIAEVNMTNPHAEADALDALLATLDEPTDEIIEPSAPPVGEHAIEAAGAEIVERTEDELAELQALEVEVGVAPAPLKVVTPTKKMGGKLTDEEKAAKKKAQDDARDAAREKRRIEREEKAAKRAAEKAAKPAPVPRKHYASKVERIADKLGDKLGDYTVLTLSDASLTGDELAAKQQETLDIVKNAGSKVQNRMTLLMEFVAGKSSKLNEVIARAFKLLHTEGKLTVGEKGNFHQNLLAKPYSPAAARAMGNNTLAAMRDFKVIAKNADGEYVANPESLVLMKVNAMLELK